MKKWQDFVFFVVILVLWNTLLEFIKSGTKTGMFNEWFVVVFGIVVFILCWIGVFFLVKVLKDKKIKKTSKKKTFSAWGMGSILFLSVLVALDMASYLFEQGLLNSLLLLFICLTFMFIGWVGCRLNNLIKQNKN